MKSFIWFGLAHLIHAERYRVEISHARDLVDEDADVNTFFYKLTRTNDPYVEILAYGDCGDECIKSEKTSVKDSDETPEWDEGFVFDEAEDECGRYEKFIFKLWDDDSTLGVSGVVWTEPDFLGETPPFYTKDVVECDEIYAEAMVVSRGGTLFVEVSKDCLSSSASSSEEKKESEEEKKDEESSDKEESSSDKEESSEEKKESEEEKKDEESEEKKESEEEKKDEESSSDKEESSSSDKEETSSDKEESEEEKKDEESSEDKEDEEKEKGDKNKRRRLLDEAYYFM